MNNVKVRMRREIKTFKERESILKVELLDDVLLWNENPRKNGGAIPKLGKLLMLYGQVSPVVVWTKNRVIYKGNTTWKALNWWRSLQEKEYQEILLSLGLSTLLERPTTIKVLWVDFKDKKEAEMYGTADNKSSEWTIWDEDKLETLLKNYNKKLEEIKGDPLGFTQEELNNLLLIPDLDKVKMSIKEVSLMETIRIRCPIAIKEDLIAWINSHLSTSGRHFKNIEVL